jgi:hypothetical protein
MSRILGSHGNEYEDGCLLGCSAAWSGRSLQAFQRYLLAYLIRPDDEGSRHLYNIGKHLPDYTLPQPRDSHNLF